MTICGPPPAALGPACLNAVNRDIWMSPFHCSNWKWTRIKFWPVVFINFERITLKGNLGPSYGNCSFYQALQSWIFKISGFSSPPHPRLFSRVEWEISKSSPSVLMHQETSGRFGLHYSYMCPLDGWHFRHSSQQISISRFTRRHISTSKDDGLDRYLNYTFPPKLKAERVCI